MSEYKLIVLDMDGTLLNSEKKISEGNKAAIKEAAEAGRLIALNTGRAIAELMPYADEFRYIRYAVSASGAVVYDFYDDKILYKKSIDLSLMQKIMEVSKLEKIMPEVVTDRRVLFNKSDIPHTAEYQMGVYRPLYEEVGTMVPSVYDEIRRVYAYGSGVQKINLYHVDREASVRTRDRLKGLPLERIFAETSSLELSAAGVDKGAGLKMLAKSLNIPISQTISVGDADNDVPMLQTAGLSVAMGNAFENALNASDVQVADCDHDGVAEAIRKYLI